MGGSAGAAAERDEAFTEGRAGLLAARPRPHHEAVREVLVEGEGLGDPVLEHDHEAQAVHSAVLLVVVTAEVREGLLLVFGRAAIQTRHGSPIEQLTRAHRLPERRKQDRIFAGLVRLIHADELVQQVPKVRALPGLLEYWRAGQLDGPIGQYTALLM